MALLKTFPLFRLSPIFHDSIRSVARHRQHRNNFKYKEFQIKPTPGEPCIVQDGMKYYPRTKDYKDPPYEPTKLFMVQRVKPLKGNPYWDNYVLGVLGLDSKDKRRVVILKNMPYNNRLLWRVRHLVKITPVDFPNGEPTEADIERTWLNHRGEMIVSDFVRTDPRAIEAREEFLQRPEYMDPVTLKEESRRRWLSGW